MQNNMSYFDYSAQHPEPVVDTFYEKGLLVIPETATEMNVLVEKNNRLLTLISAFDFLKDQNTEETDTHIQAILTEIRTILDTTAHINFSALTQFFLVYSCSYSSYKSLPVEEKQKFLHQMLLRYCQERHQMYLSHGYSNSSLQILADSYSHKRNCKTSIDKVLSLFQPYPLIRCSDMETLRGTAFVYFLPDKGDHALFEEFKNQFEIAMRSAANEQGKLPDLVFKIHDQFFICELKNIKGSGGGQDKQLTEIINFIRYSEDAPNIHYLVFLDGEYANLLFRHRQPKIRRQYNDICTLLRHNPSNFFVNTAGFSQVLTDLMRS